MPITPFQAGVFKIIAANRNPDSFVAGGIVLNRDENSVRYSNDIDLFHDTSEALKASAARDAEALTAAGYQVSFSRKDDTFHQAEVKLGSDFVRLDWAADSAFRFFPIVVDETLGYRLHDADAATNKVLAAVARRKVRDFLDLLQLDGGYMSLGIAVWAAAGKDEGLTPDWIMNELRRNSRINPETLGDLKLVHPGDAVAIKRNLLSCFESAESLISTLPPETLGALFVENRDQPARGIVFDPSWTPHYGSVKGAWPKIVTE